ncbi:MAG: trypsin-like peptidase domain-containing protein [Planctomycetota bacterium]|nr:trypsin-like peptidase domain-containing protein [Planctomycetota bacterium]
MRRRAVRSRGASLLAVCLVIVSSITAFAAEIPPLVRNAEQERIRVIAKAKATAVCIFARGGHGGGSGVLISPDGFALTNYHVVKPAGNYMKCGMDDGKLYDAVLVGLDPTGDVALIKLLGRNDFPHATLTDSNRVRSGDWCFAVGNPFLLATDFHPTVTYGIVSGVHRYQPPAGTLLEYTDCIQTDASINPGNSGGPLFNAAGDLIGVNGRGSFEKRGRVNVGVGYAISSNQLRNFLGYLKSGRIVDHATLGATVATSDDGRVVVSNILDSSNAYRRGLRYGDEIVAFSGRPISSVNEFKNVLGIYPRGWNVSLKYRRDGQDFTIVVRLMGVHSRRELLSKIQGPAAEQPEPSPKEPKPNQPDAPKRQPLPAPQIPLPQTLPPEITKLVQPREGYANYFFNLENQKRIWAATVQHGDFAKSKGQWLFSGVLTAGGNFQIALEDSRILAQFPSGPAVVDTTLDLDQQTDPEGSGGLLTALHLWRRLLTLGPDEFGEMFYLGTAPTPSQPGLFDVLVGTYNVVQETRFLFETTSGKLVGMEMALNDDIDRCDIMFSRFKMYKGLQIPHKIDVRHGNQQFATIEVSNFEIKTPTAKKP